MIENLEKLKNIMSENDSEIESMYSIVLAVGANVIPGIIFIFFYKRIYFLEIDFWKLILITVSLTVPIFMFNYQIIAKQTAIGILSNPKKIGSQAKENYLKNNNNTPTPLSNEKATEIVMDELLNVFSRRSKNILYITSKKMIFIFSITLIIYYYLGLKEHLLINKIYIFVNIEVIFFILPTMIDYFKYKKSIKTLQKS